MTWTKDELKEILQKDFIDNVDAFTAGRRNDDIVDSMCICFALDEEWIEMYAEHVDNWYFDDEMGRQSANYDWNHIKPHYERVKKWLNQKESNGYNRGETDIMTYAINY